MTNKRTTKQALVASAILLCMSFTMLLGTTFAWFTDSATSAGNKIVAGTLDVQLWMYDESESDYVNIGDKATPIFGAADSLAAKNDAKDTLWEPGKTQVVYLKLVNAGSLDLKYTVAINVRDNADDKDLYKALEYAIAPNAKQSDTELPAWNGGTKVNVGNNVATASTVTMTAGAEHYFALSVHMLEEAGNEYQGGYVEFDIKVAATQVASEEDSFGPNYDVNATLPEVDTIVLPTASTAPVDIVDYDEVADQVDTKITLPAGSAAGTYKLAVSNENVVTDAEGNTVASFDIELTRNGEKVPAGTYVVERYVGEYLNDVKVTHKGEPVAIDDYDPATGYVTFTVDSFSPFAVSYYRGIIDSVDDLVNVAKGGSFVLGADITIADTIVIPEGVSVVLDLNGKKLSTENVTKTYAINNCGTLKLLDTVGGGVVAARGIYNGYNPDGENYANAKLTIVNGTYNAMGTDGGAAVYNYGVLDIQSGTFASNGGYALNTQANGNVTVSNANVRGGIYNSKSTLVVNNSDIYQHISGRHAIYNWSGNVTVNSGSADSESGNELILADGQDAVVTINGGTFYKTAKSWLFGAATGKNITFTINGGNFNGYVNKPENSVDTIRPYGDPITVYGGTFNFDPTRWTVDGYSVVAGTNGNYTVVKGDVAANDNAALGEALKGGETDIALGAGSFDMPGTSGDVTISGTLDTVITVTTPTANNVTLNGVTVVAGSYKGIQHSDTVVFENCVIKGTQFLYANKVIFKNCTIDLTAAADYIWTYSAKNVEFIDCVFNTKGKAILIYNEGPDLVTNVTVKGCTFNATESALASGAVAAAIEIDSHYATNGHYTLTTENNIVDPDFSAEWRVKNSATNNTTVNGVVYNKVEDGLYKGTDNTFYVYNANGLKWIADNVNAGDTMSGKTITLIADIDLKNENWTTIGKNHDVEGADPFCGIFDGNGHTVYNLYISIEDDKRDSVGFIGYAKNATIKGLTIENVYINADYFVGAIVGKLSSGSISDCHVKGDINITARRNYAAGVVGDGYYSMENCSVIADETGYITSKAVAGGLCGRINEGAHSIKNCTVKNLDIRSSQQIAAISGFIHYGVTVSGCNAENVKLTLTASSATKPAIGLASGLWYYKDGAPITISDNTFKDVTISATSDATGRANILYGWEWNDNMSGIVETNNTMVNITNNINYQ